MGTDPVDHYDTDALGITGCVSPKGWECLHRPGVREISIKFFTVSNASMAVGGQRMVSLADENGLVVQENYKELADLQEVKVALRNLMKASMLATPWNFSYAVLETFLASNGYFERELENVKKGAVLTGFIDHVLRTNAANWIQEAPFLDATKLAGVWANWWSSRKACMPTVSGRQDKTKEREYFKGRSKENVPPHTVPQNKDNTCKYWHENRCRFSFRDCCKTVNGTRIRLYHRCDVEMVDSAGKPIIDQTTKVQKLCGGMHKRADHK